MLVQVRTQTYRSDYHLDSTGKEPEAHFTVVFRSRGCICSSTTLVTLQLCVASLAGHIPETRAAA